MKKVGLIGGLGPASTVYYYQGIIHGYREFVRDDSYPELVIDSVNMTEVLSYLYAKDWHGLAQALLCALNRLEKAGAEVAAIASNTPHIVWDALQKESPLPLVSIVEATCAYAREQGCRKAVVLGTGFVMASGLYENALRAWNITAVTPDARGQDEVHNIIFPKLEDGIVDPVDKRKMLALAGGLIAEHGADTLVLGCTELPLMIKPEDIDTLVLNTTQIHIDAILRAMGCAR